MGELRRATEKELVTRNDDQASCCVVGTVTREEDDVTLHMESDTALLAKSIVPQSGTLLEHLEGFLEQNGWYIAHLSTHHGEDVMHFTGDLYGCGAGGCITSQPRTGEPATVIVKSIGLGTQVIISTAKRHHIVDEARDFAQPLALLRRVLEREEHTFGNIRLVHKAEDEFVFSGNLAS
ncbi:MAG: hypothetical protein OXR66_05235 [Candidatus Woesearchaeota archaeon]|nr:hypothetical protein [Candidatus Woesearchaeota archaeon]